jgi:nitrogen-specific signal transduction histidine kinase
MTPTNADELLLRIAELHAGIRKSIHDINNPLGVIRMAAYYLKTVQADAEKREHYCTVINDSIDKLEADLKRLRALANPLPGEKLPGLPPETKPEGL